MMVETIRTLCQHRTYTELGEILVVAEQNGFYSADLVESERSFLRQKREVGVMKKDAKRFIPICCVCENVRGEAVSPGTEPEWGPLKTYLDAHHITSGEYRLSHAYCPACAGQFTKLGRTVRPAEHEERPLQDNGVTPTILDAFDHMHQCDLDMLVEACPTLTWNQVFSEVDRLSRMGHLRLSYLGQGRYNIERPQSAEVAVSS